MSDAELPAHVERRRRAKKQHIASITLADIAPYFHLPIREASRALKIGVSILKQKCRQYGIPRWPHRKIKSLDSLISDLEVNLAAPSAPLHLINHSGFANIAGQHLAVVCSNGSCSADLLTPTQHIFFLSIVTVCDGRHR
jgi:hypothetical protein